jgi:hypothetical protein
LSTFLVVKENTPDFVNHTLLPIINNLSQCATQLGMHSKTILFCEPAMAEASTVEKQQHEQSPWTKSVNSEGTDHDAMSQNHVLDYLALRKVFDEELKNSQFFDRKPVPVTDNTVSLAAQLNETFDSIISFSLILESIRNFKLHLRLNQRMLTGQIQTR